MKNLILAATLFVSSAVLANAKAEVSTSVAEYSRPLVQSLAVSYLALQLKVSYEDLKNNVDEIVVNDQNGIQRYDVEVLFKDGTAKVVTFSGLTPIEMN